MNKVKMIKALEELDNTPGITGEVEAIQVRNMLSAEEACILYKHLDKQSDKVHEDLNNMHNQRRSTILRKEGKQWYYVRIKGILLIAYEQELIKHKVI